jgi:methyl-accepting chemotaxis protein
LEGILKNDLRKKMAAQKIGDNGYIWVINSQGEHIVSKAGERDGENIFNLQQNGVYVAREIIKRAHQMKGDEMFTYYYSWKNLKDDESQKVSAASYVPEWDWIIGASAYHKDFLSGLAHIKRYIKTVVGIAIIASIFISIFFTHFIMMPVKKLDEITKQAAFGNLDVSVGEKLIEKSGEVGSLARSFRIMIFNLKKRIEETEKSKRELENGNKSLSVAKEELESKNRELEKFNKLVVDREMEMIKLKKKIKELQQDQ